jgi:hypothetical protein
MKKLIAFLCLLSVTGVYAQFEYKTGHTELVRFNGERKLAGWNFAPGLTYMYTRPKDFTDQVNLGDTVYNANWNPSGSFRAYFEAGRHHILQYTRFIHYLDYGLAWKWLAGKEKFEGAYVDRTDGASFGTSGGTGKFSSHHLLAYVNANNLWQFADNYFLQNSLGANFDWRFLGKANPGGDSPFHDPINPPRFVFQLHYKLGVGIKINDGFFIIPAIETPILNILPWSKGRSQLDTFNSRYRPLILTVRFAFLGKNKTSCNVPGISDDERKKQDEFFQQR